MSESTITSEKNATVLEIGLVKDTVTEEPMYQIVFGEIVECAPKNNSDTNKPLKKPRVMLVLQVDLTDNHLYAIGSNWKITKKTDGSVTLVVL
jgi:hypothetical protein